MTDEVSRIRRGQLLAKLDQPKQLSNNQWSVASESEQCRRYLVSLSGEKWWCECKDHNIRHFMCKHIHAVRFFLNSHADVKSALFSDDEQSKNSCKNCSSDKIIKYGKSGRNQAYYCNNCNRKFVPDHGFKKAKFDPVLIVACLDLQLERNVTLRGIADHLWKIYGIKVSHVSIYNWIEKYIRIIKEYVKNIPPAVSAQWHADETMVKVKGRWMWKWNLIDRQTRFLIASIISENRNITQARKLFRKAKMLVKTKPNVIVTDGLQVYADAVRKEFYSNSGAKTTHMAKSGFAGKTSNSIIERHNGTFKDWYKNRRGLKKVDSPLIEGRDIAQNFVHSNQALGGMTAAEAAGADEHLGNNKILGLIRRASEYAETVPKQNQPMVKNIDEVNLQGKDPERIDSWFESVDLGVQDSLPVDTNNSDSVQPTEMIRATKEDTVANSETTKPCGTLRITNRWKKNGWL